MSSPRRRDRHLAFSALAAAIGLASLATGCDKKTRECNATVGVVNDVEGRAKGHSATDAKAHAAALREIADAEEGASRELAKLAPTAKELAAMSARLQTAFGSNAASSRELATLLDHFPDEKALEGRIASTRDALNAAEQHVESKCGADAAACVGFAATLKKQPNADAIDASDPAKTKAWADGVAAWCAELAKAEVKDEALKRDLDGLQKALKDVAAVVVELSQLAADDAQREKVHQAQEKSAKEIGALVDELNKYCQDP